MDPAQFFAASRLVIVAGKGGVGKTTVTAALARAAAHTELSTLIVEVEGDGAGAALANQLAGRAWMRSIEKEERTLRITVSDLLTAQREIPTAIAAAGVALRRFEIEEASLEQVFVEIVGGTTP